MDSLQLAAACAQLARQQRHCPHEPFQPKDTNKTQNLNNVRAFIIPSVIIESNFALPLLIWQVPIHQVQTNY